MNTQQTPSLDKILNSLNAGHFKGEAGDKLAELTQFVKFHGKPGKLVIEVEVKPVNHSEMAVTVSGNCKLSLPKIPATPVVFFVTDDGEMTLNNPEQADIFVRAVPTDSMKLSAVTAGQ